MTHHIEVGGAALLAAASTLSALFAESSPEAIADAGGGGAVLLLAYLLHKHLTKLESKLEAIERAVNAEVNDDED